MENISVWAVKEVAQRSLVWFVFATSWGFCCAFIKKSIFSSLTQNDKYKPTIKIHEVNKKSVKWPKPKF